MTRKNHDLGLLEDIARIMQTNQSVNVQTKTVINWISNPSKNMEEITLIAEILEKMLGFKYFINLKNKLTQPDYQYFLTHLSVEHRARGSIVIDKGKKNDNFYVILQGEVLILDEITKEMANYLLKSQNHIPDSHEPTFEMINVLKPGDTFGEVSLINPKMLTTARVVAKCDTTLLVANQDTFYRTLNVPEHMKYSEKLNYFRNNILFQDVEQDRLRELLAQIREIRFNLNEQIYSIGNSHEEMYFVVQGEVELLNADRKGFVILGPKEYFGVERDVSYNGHRSESAISKSQQLIVYRIFFKRLVVMDDSMSKFINNLMISLKKKTTFYKQLQQNHKLVNSMIQNPQLAAKKYKKRKRKNGRNYLNKPTLEWWGVTNSLNSSKLENIKRVRYSNLWRPELNCSSQVETLAISTNHGISKLTNFIRLCKNKLNEVDPIQKSQEQLEKETAYIPLNTLTCSFAKKSLRLVIDENSFGSEMPLRPTLPKINKSKLLKYAKSSDNFCEKLYFD